MATTAYDSLVIGEEIEVWGPPGGIASANPMCPGAVFRIQPPFSLDAPQPTTDFVATLIVDGEKPYGDRASDRTITLNVIIVAPDYRTLAGARELLLQTIDQPHWPLTWTRASGADPGSLPMVLDCFRAQPAVIPMGGPEDYRIQGRLQVEALVTIKFEALPYGRSDTQQQVAFAAPIASINSPGVPPAPIVLDAFTQINSPQCVQSSQCVIGPNSCHWDPQYPPFSQDDGQNCPLTYSASLTNPVSLSGMTGLSLWLGLGTRYYFNHHPRGLTRVVLSFSLTDTNGVVLAWTYKTDWLPVSTDPNTPVFTKIAVRIPQNSGTFNYGSVAAYSLTITNRAPRWDTPGGELRWTVAYLDALTAYSSSNVVVAPSIRGSVYTLYGVVGTHRAPVSMQFQSAPAPGTPTTVTSAGSSTYTVPGGTLYLKVEANGGGGAGATQTVSGFGGGGGGGEYAAEPVFPAAVGAVIQYAVGAGDTSGSSATFGRPTSFGPAPGGTLAVTANGGQSAAQNSITGGSGGSGSANSIHFSGGMGRTASGSVGGGGGSSGGNASAGNTPTGTAAITFTSAGANTWTCPAGVTQVYAECWGGGASGGTGSTGANGGGGSGGEYAAAFVSVTPGNVYNYTVGAGGGAVTGTGLTGNSGSNSVFTGNAVTVTAHSGHPGTGSNNNTGAAGGSGSTNTVHFNGGAGGGGNPYSGGGGSSAGPAATGNPGNSYGNAGTAPSGGGSGGPGTGSGSGNATAGSAPGGGGGGTYFNSTTSGAGAAGQVRLTYPGGGAPTNTGGVAVAGGGAGGAGGGSANTAGSAGSAPGGGGGGGDSSGSTEAGGAGGTGKLIITPYASSQFKTLIVHRPGKWSPTQLNPFVPVGAGLVAPGATEYCVSTDTEILTQEGWRHPDDLTGSETVLTLNMKTGLSEWQPLNAVHVFPAQKRKMLALDSPVHSSVSTLDHRWAVQYNNKLRIQSSTELNSASGLVRRAMCADLPTEPKYSDALVELVAWYTTEGNRRMMPSGNLGNSMNIGQSARVNAPHVERIRAALTVLYGPSRGLFKRDAAGPQWREYHKNDGMVIFYLDPVASAPVTEQAPGPDYKVREDFVTSLTKAQLALFLDTCVAGDGSTHRRSSTRYIGQRVAARLDAMEIAALLLGFSTSRRVGVGKNSGMTNLTIGTTTASHPIKAPGKTAENTRLGARKACFIDYTGQVWCPETSNGTWLARRNGTTYFTGNTVPSLVSGVNADFNGTYSVVLTNFSFNSASSPRTISVSVKQYESSGGASYTTTTTPITITPSTQVTNGIVVVGTLTLPLKAVAADNTAGYFTVLVSDTNTSDRWFDCLFLDVQGTTTIVNEPSTGYINYYFDEADPCHDLGNYLGSQAGRPAAVSVTDALTISGGPLTVEPGTNTLLAYSQEGAPSISLSYFPRWFSERLE